jgi:hypothetical protein
METGSGKTIVIALSAYTNETNPAP